MQLSIILISSQGLAVAQKIKSVYPKAEIFSKQVIAGAIQIDDLDKLIQSHFSSDIAPRAIVFVGAVGICIRMIAPYIKDKYTDPAVLCIDSQGDYVIPLLSGHIGGANELAGDLAHILHAEAAITTQSDRMGLWALDILGKKYGWQLEPHFSQGESDREQINKLIALFLQQVPTLLLIEGDFPGIRELEATKPKHVEILYRPLQEVELSSYELILRVSPFTHPGDIEKPLLQFIPPVWHLGVGLAHQAQPVEEIWEALKQEMTTHGLHPLAIKNIATIVEKKEEPVIKQLQKLGYSVSFFTAEELKDIPVPTPSAVVNKHMGTASVSEASAIRSAHHGSLVMPKQKDSNGKYTLAVAVEPKVLHTKQGHIEIVGAGPGDPELISLRGKRMLERADLVLYAGSLVPKELTQYAPARAHIQSSASMNLEEQFALMKEYYDAGKFIVRLHTGDPCIYGAIEEQMNYFDQHGMDYHITPGISSFQAAAAELRSQFTIPEKVQTIILTRGEGRTPMPEKEKLHLLARSQSTMCIFLSASIVDEVERELLEEYPEETPVAICYHLTWPDQKIYRGVLKDLAKIVHEHKLTLTTMIVVGEAIDNREGLSRLYADEFKHLFRP